MTNLPRCWVLLRGLARESRHWFDFPSQFARALGVRCLLLDLPGTGDQHGRSASASAAAQVRELELQLAGHREPLPEGPWGVLAISFGSMVAFEWAARRPDRISHLVSINASDRHSPPYCRLRPGALVRLIQARLQRSLPERERRLYRLTTNAPLPDTEAWALGATEIARTRPVHPNTIARQLLAAARFSVPRIEQPCLLLSSQADRLVSPSCSGVLARQLGAPHYSHAEAGHDLPLDDPGWVIHQIRCWLAEEPRPQGSR
jgi:pimeloyl-ACP methyl ester carboxylesterase